MACLVPTQRYSPRIGWLSLSKRDGWVPSLESRFRWLLPMLHNTVDSTALPIPNGLTRAPKERRLAERHLPGRRISVGDRHLQRRFGVFSIVARMIAKIILNMVPAHSFRRKHPLSGLTCRRLLLLRRRRLLSAAGITDNIAFILLLEDCRSPPAKSARSTSRRDQWRRSQLQPDSAGSSQ